MLGDMIKKLRLEKGITQDELAKKLNLSASTISLYENNMRDPDIRTLIDLSKVFDVTTDYLLELSKEKHGNIEEITRVTDIYEYLEKLENNIKTIEKIIAKSNSKEK